MKKSKIIIGLIISISLVAFMLILHKYNCLFKFIFGISCPMCGMTRAICSALRLNFKQAFYYHLAWPAIIVIFVLYILIKFKIIKINKKYISSFLLVFSVLNLIYYFYRLTHGSAIVELNFKQSLIYKTYALFASMF